MKLKYLYAGNLLTFILMLAALLTSNPDTPVSLILPVLCLLPLFLMVTGGSFFTTLYVFINERAIVSKDDAQRLQRARAKSQHAIG